MGVYSPSMILHFPEQIRDFQYFNATPSVNSGYTPIGTPVTVHGVIQNDVTAIRESNGTIVNIDHMNVWIDSQLNRGWFLLFQETMFRIVNGNDWPFEGGYYLYTIERVVGDNGTPSTVVWNKGGTLI